MYILHGHLLPVGGEVLPEVRDIPSAALSVIPHIPGPNVSTRMIGGNLDSVVLGVADSPSCF